MAAIFVASGHGLIEVKTPSQNAEPATRISSAIMTRQVGAGILGDVLDKCVTLLLVRTLLHSLPMRMVSRFPLADRALGRS